MYRALKLIRPVRFSSTAPGEPNFLQSVEQFFNRAAPFASVTKATLSHIKATDGVLAGISV
jgi:glutamate dehydrogenase (NAD(P)+)